MNRAAKVFTITEKAPTRVFSWLKVPSSTFTFKTLLRHYSKRPLTPVQVDVKLCLTWRHAQLVLRHAVDPLHIVAGAVAAGNQAGCKKSQDANYIHLKLFSFHTKCKDNAFHLLCLILYNINTKCYGDYPLKYSCYLINISKHIDII